MEGIRTGGSELEIFQKKNFAVNADGCEEHEHSAPSRAKTELATASEGCDKNQRGIPTTSVKGIRTGRSELENPSRAMFPISLYNEHMHKKLRIWVFILILSAIIGLSAWFYLYGESFSFFQSTVENNLLMGVIVYIILEILSVVVVPVATLFLTPIAVAFFGPFLTAIYSIIGWMIGSIVAFLIARKYGRPIVKKFFDLEKIEKYRSKISPNMEFGTLVLLRMLFPVDVLSYALGLFSLVSFRRYVMTTLIGIAPFSFLFAYGGNALISGNYVKLGLIAIIGFALLLFLFLIDKNRD